MPRPVYSQGFIYYSDATPNTSFEVPAGFTAVIRDFTLWTNLGASQAQIDIQNDEEAPIVRCAYLYTVGVTSYAQWTGRVVVPAMGLITLSINSADLESSMYVGGYLLRNAS